MIQAIGLTSASRGDEAPAVDDLTFDARPGEITALLGDSGAGKSTALRLMLELEPGRGITLFGGRPLHRHAHPANIVGVLLGDVPGHPSRTARGHLRMLAAAAGAPAERADQVLEIVGLRDAADRRLGEFSLGMDRRLGVAAALLGDPPALLLDDPAQDLSPRDTAWLYGLLKTYAARGGTVVVTVSDPRTAGRLADRIVTLDAGRLVADQSAQEFGRGRLRPYVAVQSPQAERLALLLAGDETEITHESGSRICVYGTTTARIGETAFRHGILLHRLADEVGDTGVPESPHGDRAPGAVSLAPVREARPPAGPARPVRYELRRLAGIRGPWLIALAGVLASALSTLVLLRTGHHAVSLRLLTGWAHSLPLPPAALGGGLLGALSYGQEFRYPALAPANAPVPRQLRLLLAKLVVNGGAALAIAGGAAAAGVVEAHFLGGHGLPRLLVLARIAVTWGVLALVCCWAGVLAAGVFRTTALGLAGVLAVPLLVAPVVRRAATAPAIDAVRLATQPVRYSFVLSLFALLCAYVATVLRRRNPISFR
ncbi:ATP-binding cassette domain-containing protein [Streptomyces sp. NPDC002574]|uniref:ATP-binding cassette domain-containing protein n=1 Tax=Streptomyces sp. NPDC002574 TaxID=3364652 RepID=UPI0036BCAA21